MDRFRILADPRRLGTKITVQVGKNGNTQLENRDILP